MVTLRVLEPYVSNGHSYPGGAVVDVEEGLAAWLMRDAPGCFEIVKEQAEVKAVDAAPVDKKLRRGRTK